MRLPTVSALALICACLSSFAIAASADEQILPVVPLASSASRPLVPVTLGVLVNTDDTESIRLGAAYAKRRGIPPQNIIAVTVPQRLGMSVEEALPALQIAWQEQERLGLRGFAIAWQRPYRVGEQSLTSALTQGLTKVRKTQTCQPTDRNPVFRMQAGSSLTVPVSMMLIGGLNYTESRQLVDRAGEGDGKLWPGTVYQVLTPDQVRSGPRESGFVRARSSLSAVVKIKTLRDAELTNAAGILGYQVGAIKLNKLSTLTFLDGAFADNLTSFGGRLFDAGGQTPITDFMRAGATGSYGTVSEPCNFAEKFPDSYLMLSNYLAGDSLVEAYWKSVAETTEGLFIGEPLARPFYPITAILDGPVLRLVSNRLTRAGRYDLYRVESGVPVRIANDIRIEESAEAERLIVELPSDIVDRGAILGLARRVEEGAP